MRVRPLQARAAREAMSRPRRTPARRPGHHRLAAAITISTRRFFALPAAVSLLATGRESPKPCADMRFGGTPLLAK